MPTYHVTLHETLEYQITVEAENSEEAGDLARDIWEGTEDPTEEFSYLGLGVEVVGWEEKK